ncbi:MAG: hypothetical protein M0P61_00115 [Ignavibacteriaceae bacterium]|jgi:hypothetical protein|nr:hypothetical protein [Ignavibacteriaceae bacterium]
MLEKLKALKAVIELTESKVGLETVKELIMEIENRPIEQQVSREVGGREKNIVKDIATIINQHSRENASNTPDFILAEYLERCLITFEMASNAREKWYGKKLSIGGTDSNFPEEGILKDIIFMIRSEFLLNTQNYPKEYHSMVDSKIKRLIKQINEKYKSNFPE